MIANVGALRFYEAITQPFLQKANQLYLLEFFITFCDFSLNPVSLTNLPVELWTLK